jgi:hypothetical protein
MGTGNRYRTTGSALSPPLNPSSAAVNTPENPPSAWVDFHH